MAISKLFSLASGTVTPGHYQGIATDQSVTGRRIAQVRGPYFYTWAVSPKTMYTDSQEYKDLYKALRGIKSGVDVLYTEVPSIFLVEGDNEGTFAGSPKVKGSSQTGTTINLNSFNTSQTSVLKDGQYLQFGATTKVYQVVGDYDSDASGNAVSAGTSNEGVQLNTALTSSPENLDIVRSMSDCQWKLELLEYNDPTLTTVNGDKSVATWGPITMREVL